MRRSKIVLSDEEVAAECKARGEDANAVMAERQANRARVQGEYDRGLSDPVYREMRAKFERRKKNGEIKVIVPEPRDDYSSFPTYEAPGKVKKDAASKTR